MQSRVRRFSIYAVVSIPGDHSVGDLPSDHSLLRWDSSRVAEQSRRMDLVLSQQCVLDDLDDGNITLVGRGDHVVCRSIRT